MLNLSYPLKLISFSAIVFIAAYVLSGKFQLPLYFIILLSGYFTAFSWVLNYKLNKALTAENKNQFTNTFLALTGLKIFSSLALVAFAIYFSKDNKFQVGVCTMVFYLVYTFFEVSHWLGKLKQS